MEAIMMYEYDYDVWTIWVGQEPHSVEINDQLDMMIGDQYISVRIILDLQGDWNVCVEELTMLTLRKHEVYKVKYPLFSFEGEAPI